MSYTALMDTSFIVAFATIAVGVGGGMALAQLLPINMRNKRALLGPFVAATMILGTRLGFLKGLGPHSDFAGDPTGQMAGVLVGMAAVWLIFLLVERRLHRVPARK